MEVTGSEEPEGSAEVNGDRVGTTGPPDGDAAVGDGGIEGGGCGGDEAKREGVVGGVPGFVEVGGGDAGTEGDIRGRDRGGEEEEDGEG